MNPEPGDPSAPSAVMFDQSLACWSGGFTAQERDDLRDCLLDAHGFATRAYDPRTLQGSWVERYRSRVLKHGCELLAPVIHQPRVVRSLAELNQGIREVIELTGSRGMANLVWACLEALNVQRFAKDFFAQGDADSTRASFQMASCERSAAGETVFMLCAMRLTAYSDSRDHGLWHEIRRDMVLTVRGGLYRFDQGVYAGHRERIRSQLSRESLSRVQALKL